MCVRDHEANAANDNMELVPSKVKNGVGWDGQPVSLLPGCQIFQQLQWTIGVDNSASRFVLPDKATWRRRADGLLRLVEGLVGGAARREKNTLFGFISPSSREFSPVRYGTSIKQSVQRKTYEDNFYIYSSIKGTHHAPRAPRVINARKGFTN